ncbi:small ribosomal subunit Rsm22 family protein [Petrachloros mirabilis]
MRPLNPASVSPLLLQAIKHVVKKTGVPRAKVEQAVGELSRLFTKERTALNRSYLDDPSIASGYLQYFLPVNLCKIQTLLEEMPAPETNEPLKVLDIGSGPGTGGLAVLDWWHRANPGAALSVVAVDASPTTLRQARLLWDGYCRADVVAKASLEICEEDVERGTWIEKVKPRAQFDIIILANCLNELYSRAKDPIAARADLVAELLPVLASSGTLMIIEPALRETSRALHQVRDHLLQDKRCTIYSPCLHENNCPALINPDDWCHEERVWEPPASIQEIDEQVGFIKDALKFSYLLLRKDGKKIADRRPDVYRVVSELREMKGEKRAWLCNEMGRQEVGRQDRLASPQNEAFDRWHRGAIVQIERIVHKEKGGKVSALGRIEQDASVQVIRSV